VTNRIPYHRAGHTDASPSISHAPSRARTLRALLRLTLRSRLFSFASAVRGSAHTAHSAQRVHLHLRTHGWCCLCVHQPAHERLCLGAASRGASGSAGVLLAIGPESGARQRVRRQCLRVQHTRANEGGLAVSEQCGTGSSAAAICACCKRVLLLHVCCRCMRAAYSSSSERMGAYKLHGPCGMWR
jgi:hypothetical protein